MTRLLLALCLLLAAPTVTHAELLDPPQPPCHAYGTAPLTAPDNARACTPGAYDRLSHAQVCTPRTRPTLTAAVRRDMLARYGVPAWTGADGELDHRVPFFLGGRTVRRNLWPERGSIPNPKDRLESYVYRRVCQRQPWPMRVRTARRIFLADWRAAFDYYLTDGQR